MNHNFIDLTGKKYGRLSIINRAPNKNGRVYWNCICDCGAKTVTSRNELRSGDSQSCGCYHKEQARIAKLTHGDTGTRLHSIWTGIKDRCTNPNNKDYEHYMGKGVSMCPEWFNSYETFKKWALTNGYKDTLSIDRIGGNTVYSPNSCRWATGITQNRNRSKILHIKGKKTSSTYIGISWHKSSKRWMAQISVNKKRIHLGYFNNEKSAAKIRDEYIRKNKLNDFTLNF